MTPPGLIETVRVADGRVPLWPWHRRRLLSSAAALGHTLPPRLPDQPELARAAARLGTIGPVAVRLTLRAGAVRLEPRPLGPARPWRACAAPGPPPAARHKTTERAAHGAAAAHAAARGCDETLWRNAQGDLVEGSISNLFVLVDGEIRTPPLESGCLPGIARARLIACGRILGLPVRQARLGVPELLRAREAFCTNAARGAVPLLSWEDRNLPSAGFWRAASAAIFATRDPEPPGRGAPLPTPCGACGPANR